jgi:hypothetical protein
MFYIGISMVCMITLQKRAGHEIATFDSTRPLHLIPCMLRTLLRHNNHSTITSAEGYASWRGWEKGSTSKKNHPPTCTVHHPQQCRRLKTSRSPPLTKKFQYRQRSLIQWLYLHHCFLQAYFASHKPTTKLMNHPHQQHRARYYPMLIPLKPLLTNYKKRLIMSSTSENIPMLFWETKTIAPPNIIPLFTRHQRLTTG